MRKSYILYMYNENCTTISLRLTGITYLLRTFIYGYKVIHNDK